MSRALLDVNVLLALKDAEHIWHERAHDWLATDGTDGWASCAITQNGAVRIISQPGYPNPLPVARAIGELAHDVAGGDHEFWTCDVSLLDPAVVDRSRLHGHRQVTDAYLLALAVSRDATFATFDRSVPLSAVRGAAPRHLSIVG